jgi:outer membrane protein assembly factor BamB
MYCKTLTILSSIVLLHTAASAADWPQWLGPERNGISAETDLLKSWPASGPQTLWRQSLGRGFSGISISQGRAFTMYAADKDEFIVCLDAATGKELWRFRTDNYYREGQGGDGPRSTPTVDGDHVYVLSAQGKLYALQAADGKKIWSHDLKEEFGSEVPTWGFCTSPIVEGDLLYVEAGGKRNNFILDFVFDPEAEATVVAFDKNSGAAQWIALDDKSAYSSPIAITVAGIRQLVFLTAYAAVGLSPQDGQVYWRYPWATRYDVNAATPVFIPPDKIFISSGYDKGAALVQLKTADEGLEAEEVWMNRVMKNHFSTSVLHQGYLYGFDNAILTCIDPQTGTEKWKQRGYGKGSLIIADGHLIILGDSGNLALVEATPAGYQEKATLQILQGTCWTVPTLSDGRLYLRSENEIVCLDLKDKS